MSHHSQLLVVPDFENSKAWSLAVFELVECEHDPRNVWIKTTFPLDICIMIAYAPRAYAEMIILALETAQQHYTKEAASNDNPIPPRGPKGSHATKGRT